MVSSFFFWLYCTASCKILVPWLGWNPCPLQWKHRILTTGLPGKSLVSVFCHKGYWRSQASLLFSPKLSREKSHICVGSTRDPVLPSPLQGPVGQLVAVWQLCLSERVHACLHKAGCWHIELSLWVEYLYLGKCVFGMEFLFHV